VTTTRNASVPASVICETRPAFQADEFLPSSWKVTIITENGRARGRSRGCVAGYFEILEFLKDRTGKGLLLPV